MTDNYFELNVFSETELNEKKERSVCNESSISSFTMIQYLNFLIFKRCLNNLCKMYK